MQDQPERDEAATPEESETPEADAAGAESTGVEPAEPEAPEAESPKGEDAAPDSLHERLSFNRETGEIRDDDVRYVLVRADNLMGLFHHIEDDDDRSAALKALMVASQDSGGKSAERVQVLEAAGPEKLIALIEDLAPQLGWGSWTLQRSETGGLKLEVENSPFAEGYGQAKAPVCAPISGLLAAVASLVTGKEMNVRETSCAAMGAGSCRFRAVPGR